MIRPAVRTLAAFVLPLGFAFASWTALRVSNDSEVRADLEKRIREVQGASRAVLKEALERTEKAATVAASVPGLQSHVQYGSDRATILDGLSTEDWWREVRGRFPVSGLVVADLRTVAVVGLPAGASVPEALVRAAQESRKASAVLNFGGQPYLAGASEVRAPGTGAVGVVLLARPLDAATLEGLARAAGGALLLTSAGKPVAAAGPPQEKGRLASMVDRPTDHWVAGADGTWAAAGEAIAPEIFLWSYAGASATGLASAMVDRRIGQGIWVACALLSLGLGLFALRRQRRPAVEAGSSPPLGAAPPKTPAGDDVSNSRTRVWPGAQDLPEVAPPLTGPPPQANGALTPPRSISGVGSGLNPDRVFGPYYLLDKLATGGMGEVFTAVAFGAEGFKRVFVVKRLRPEFSENQDLIDQFINEARLGAALVHSNIIPIFDFGKVGDRYYLAEEYILGRNLESIVSRCLEVEQRPLPMELTLFVVHETLKALAYAHSRANDSGTPMGLVHRDISPSNIMVSGRGEVKLLDFGIAKQPGGGAAQTRHGVVKGNMTYMAPEQARGLPVDARTDLFSLGLVIFRCLNGRPLYHGTELHHLLLKAADGPGEEEWSRIQAMPEPAGVILAKALQPDPSMRFGSAEEFAAAIPHLTRSPAANLSNLVQALFADELRREQQQINSAISTAARRAVSAS